MTDLDLSTAAAALPYAAAFEIEFPTAHLVSIAFNSLVVDEELQPDKVSRRMHIVGHCLKIDFRSDEVRLLRTVVNGFFESLLLVQRTMAEFGPL